MASTTTTLAPPPVPVYSPILDKNGDLTIAWLQYFIAIAKLAATQGSGSGTGAAGPAGPQGPQGTQGDVGPAGPAGGAGAYVVIVPGGGATATPDLANGSGTIFEILLNAPVIQIMNPIGTSSNDRFWIVLKQDGTGQRGISWGSNYVGTAHQLWADQPGFYWAAEFVVRPDGKAMMITIPQGGGPYVGGPY